MGNTNGHVVVNNKYTRPNIQYSISSVLWIHLCVKFNSNRDGSSKFLHLNELDLCGEVRFRFLRTFSRFNPSLFTVGSLLSLKDMDTGIELDDLLNDALADFDKPAANSDLPSADEHKDLPAGSNEMPVMIFYFEKLGEV